MLDPNDIQLFFNLYSEYLLKSNFRDSEFLNLFLLELKKSQYLEMKASKKYIKDIMISKSIPASSAGLYKCKNYFIIKWYNLSRVVKVVSKSDVNLLNYALEPVINQNRLERVRSLEATRNTLVGR